MGYTKGFVRLKAGEYLAISNDDRWLEVRANSAKEAKEIARSVWANMDVKGPAKTIRVTRIPEMIFCADSSALAAQCHKK